MMDIEDKQIKHDIRNGIFEAKREKEGLEVCEHEWKILDQPTKFSLLVKCKNCKVERQANIEPLKK